MRKLDLAKIQPLINMAVKEDFGTGDPTSRITVADDITATARIITREEIVVCGMEIIREVLKKYDKRHAWIASGSCFLKEMKRDRPPASTTRGTGHYK